MKRRSMTRTIAAAALYAAAPLYLLAHEAPAWRHTPPSQTEEETPAAQPVRPVREERELMRVVTFYPHVEEGSERIKDPDNPEGPMITRFVEGVPGYAVLEGPFRIEVRLPDDCDWKAVGRSVGSQIMVDTRYWVSPDGKPNSTVFMPTTRRALCSWNGTPVAERRAPEPAVEAGKEAAGEASPDGRKETE